MLLEGDDLTNFLFWNNGILGKRMQLHRNAEINLQSNMLSISTKEKTNPNNGKKEDLLLVLFLSQFWLKYFIEF